MVATETAASCLSSSISHTAQWHKIHVVKASCERFLCPPSAAFFAGVGWCHSTRFVSVDVTGETTLFSNNHFWSGFGLKPLGSAPLHSRLRSCFLLSQSPVSTTPSFSIASSVTLCCHLFRKLNCSATEWQQCTTTAAETHKQVLEMLWWGHHQTNLGCGQV